MASLPPLQPATSGSRTQDMMMEDRNTAWMGTVARIIFRQKPCLGSGGAIEGSWLSSSVEVPRLVTLSALKIKHAHFYVCRFLGKKWTFVTYILKWMLRSRRLMKFLPN